MLSDIGVAKLILGVFPGLFGGLSDWTAPIAG